MTHDDETVERVARALAANDAINGRSPHLHYEQYADIMWIPMARAALSAMPHAAADRLSQLEGEVGRLREALRNLCATLDRLGDNGVYVIDTGLAHAYAASLAALEHQQKGEKL